MYIIHETIDSRFQFNAGSKARNDIEDIVCMYGAKKLEVNESEIPDRKKANIFKKLYFHKQVANDWIRQVDLIEEQSIVFIQFPIFCHTFLFGKVIRFLQKKGCYVVAVIHDMETLRNAKRKRGELSGTSRRYILEERLSLPKFNLVVAHNEIMRQLLIEKLGMNPEKIATISIFDYLIPDYTVAEKEVTDTKGYAVIIAGNLKKEKTGYIYNLPSGIQFELYGSNYEGETTDQIHYNGCFLPEELPFHLKGDFGLVWDGPSAESCVGMYGEYLKYNNPHKTSLYLACGLPVLIWKDAAMAQFVQDNQCGLLVDSIAKLPDLLHDVSPDMYKKLKENSVKIGAQLREGRHTEKIINTAKEQQAKLKNK